MTDMEYVYLIMFDGWIKPEKIIVKDYMELQRTIANMVDRLGKPYEWVIRIYR